MTIAEYIELLKKLPQNALVKAVAHEYYEGNVTYEEVQPEDVMLGPANELLVNINH